MDEITARLQQYLDFKNLSAKDFERATGLGNGTCAKISKRTRQTTLDRISNSGIDLNVKWLLTGEGEMLDQDRIRQQDVDELVKDKASTENEKLIPFYDAETTGGFDGLVSSSNAIGFFRGYINAGDWFGGVETAAIRHVGNSMLEYPDGCVLALKEVKERRLLIPGENYVIETDEYRVTKRVQKGSTKNSIALYSSNQEKYEDGRLVYEPFEVDVSDIRRIFSILGFIVNNSGRAMLIRP